MYHQIQQEMFLLSAYLDGDLLLSDMTLDQMDTIKIVERKVGEEGVYQDALKTLLSNRNYDMETIH